MDDFVLYEISGGELLAIEFNCDVEYLRLPLHDANLPIKASVIDTSEESRSGRWDRLGGSIQPQHVGAATHISPVDTTHNPAAARATSNAFFAQGFFSCTFGRHCLYQMLRLDDGRP
jgi:hypothetical protein